jgi:branched-chain amino acid transport system permease protein
MLIQLLANGLVVGCSYGLVALGFALIYNTTRIFHFGHGAIYVLSAYIFHVLHNLWHLPGALSVAATLILAAACGIAVDELVYAPLMRRGAPPSVAMLSSIGFYVVVVNLITLIFGSATVVLVAGTQPTVSLGPVVLTRFQVATALSFVLLFALVVLLLRVTGLGKLIRAARDNPVLVSAIGIGPRRARWAVFALGSALAAVAALLLGSDLGLDPNIGMQALLYGAVAAIVGGIGVFEGAAIGAILLGLLQSLAVWKLSAKWQFVAAFVLLIAFLLLRPEGILGRRRRVEETLL